MDELLTNLSLRLTPRLRSIFVNNDYSFYDVADIENFPPSQTSNLVKSSKHISFYNKKLKIIISFNIIKFELTIDINLLLQ